MKKIKLMIIRKILNRIKFNVIEFYHAKIVLNFSSKESVFTSIWKNNYWGDAESLSGGGSTLAYTAGLREKFPEILTKFEIKVVFDAPCGDMNWMQYLIKEEKFTYLGGDIVSDIIEENKKKFIYNYVSFFKFDITNDTFPTADIWICRAVLYHLSNKDIFLALKKFSESKIKYILTTNCVTDSNHINRNIKTGDWRTLNLMLPPFNFPKNPLWEVDDYIEPYPPERICLWTREQIIDVLSKQTYPFE